ncbi:MAG: GH1 family beta-glucosidase [Hyphomonadaceae bacterium JAD_PAG50586_4]|nr:MAG: GH1 family beta-glucosidase [Hyphomonadaceae bacterium JAD_PAG50586_4]
MDMTRRGVALGVAGAALAGCAPDGATAFAPPRDRQFPQGFLWGVASSSFQIEGALDADGRGQSIWDVFPRDKIHDGSDAAIANDSYHRYAEDVALIAGAGMNAYRFSIAWPRILPSGAGAVNEAGLDYYSRLIDALLARGVAPYATLFHWDLPLALEGGWANRDTALRFGDYAQVVAERLGDRLKHIVVLNEAAVHAVLGHVYGAHAPGLTDASLMAGAIHHQNLAQGLSIQAMRSVRNDLTIGTTMALMPARTAGGWLGPLHRMAAQGFDEVWNRAFLDPLFLGAYPKIARDMVKSVLREGDMEIVRQPIDFLGVNYYAPTYMRFDLGAPSFLAPADPPAGSELDAFARHVDPSGLHEVLARLRHQYGNPRVYITENGCSDAFSDGPAEIDDQFRIDFLRRHLEAVKSAMEGGSDIGGYFHWTLTDNWEWAEGYRSKFGLVAQDRATGVRTPKASYAWFGNLARTGVLD